MNARNVPINLPLIKETCNSVTAVGVDLMTPSQQRTQLKAKNTLEALPFWRGCYFTIEVDKNTEWRGSSGTRKSVICAPIVNWS
jgi:hypothetical protein